MQHFVYIILYYLGHKEQYISSYNIFNWVLVFPADQNWTRFPQLFLQKNAFPNKIRYGNKSKKKNINFKIINIVTSNILLCWTNMVILWGNCNLCLSAGITNMNTFHLMTVFVLDLDMMIARQVLWGCYSTLQASTNQLLARLQMKYFIGWCWSSRS